LLVTLLQEKCIMPRGIKKENLPSKICVICNQSFNWRKKWEKDWDQITTCSNRCNSDRKDRQRKANREARLEQDENKDKV